MCLFPLAQIGISHNRPKMPTRTTKEAVKSFVGSPKPRASELDSSHILRHIVCEGAKVSSRDPELSWACLTLPHHANLPP